MSNASPTTPGPALSVIVPTRNERDNIVPLYERLCVVLRDIDWEAIFVDDDSQDGTVEAVRALAEADRRIRLLRRIGRRGLSSACIEGFEASSARVLAVMDADLQHDEALLPQMLNVLRSEPVDVVIGSRYVGGGGVGDWQQSRARLSRLANWLVRRFLRARVTDPVSGFFMLTREAFDGASRRLSLLGFKILIDILASSPRPLRVRELPFHFRSRHAGESKFDTLIGVEFLILLLDKLIGHLLPIRFVLFAVVGGLGIFAHVVILWFFLIGLQFSFPVSQTVATVLAMIGNFSLNNWLTYRDRRLTGWRWLFGLVSFSLICGVGAAANIGIASFLFGGGQSSWWLAGIAGAIMSLVWNYTMTSMITWRR
jgi:dolichol-phosphate mannosyltransferase